MYVCMLCHVWLFAIPWTVACQAPLSTGFSSQEYWSGLPFPPGDLPDLSCIFCFGRWILYHCANLKFVMTFNAINAVGETTALNKYQVSPAGEAVIQRSAWSGPAQRVLQTLFSNSNI